MDDGKVIAALERVVETRTKEVRADARRALALVTGCSEWPIAGVASPLLAALRDEPTLAAVRKRLLATVAPMVILLGDGGWPLFRSAATLLGQAALSLAAASDDELGAALEAGGPLPLVDPVGQWEELLEVLSQCIEAGRDGSLDDLRRRNLFSVSIVESEFDEWRLRTVGIACGPVLLTVTQKVGEQLVLHAVGAADGGREQQLDDGTARQLGMAATVAADDPTFYVDPRRGIAAVRRRLVAAVTAAGNDSWRPIGESCPIGAGRSRELLGAGSGAVPRRASAWQLALCVGATRVLWLEDFPLDEDGRLVLLAWFGDERPIAVTHHNLACHPAVDELRALALVLPPTPDSPRTEWRRGELVRDELVDWQSVDRLTPAQVDRLSQREFAVRWWLQDGSVLIGMEDHWVIAPDGSESQPTHVPVGGLELPLRFGFEPIL